jgi:hypothetical protein
LALPAAGVHALTWRYDTSEQNNKAQERSSVYGKYASTVGWTFADCKDGKPADEGEHKPVLPAARLSKHALCLTPTHLERPLMKFTKNKQKEQ